MILDNLPDPYGREIKGISSATGIPLGTPFKTDLLLCVSGVGTGRELGRGLKGRAKSLQKYVHRDLNHVNVVR